MILIVIEDSEASDSCSDSEDGLPSLEVLLKRNTPSVNNPDLEAMQAKGNRDALVKPISSPSSSGLNSEDQGVALK